MQDLLEKDLSFCFYTTKPTMSPKKCVFGCEGKMSLFSFPKNPALREQWKRVVFPGQERSCASVFVCSRHFGDECFMNKAQFDAGFADRLKLKDGAVPAGTDPGHEPRTSVHVKCSSAPSQKNAATQTGALCVEMWRRVASTSGLAAKRRRMEEEEEGRLSETPQPHEPSDVSDYTEPKYVVFESRLRELFQTCPLCTRDCAVQRRRLGTFVWFRQVCGRCGYTKEWQSQPVRGSTPLGNLQMSAAVYFTGGSFAQMDRICRAMNLQIHGFSTFRRHTRVFLEPSVHHKWKTDQQAVFQTLRAQGEIALSGDMCAHSPGRSAKYGSYTLMHLESSRILDVQLVQSSGVGGRAHMEKEGLRRGLDLLESNQLHVDYMVTDRHTRVQKDLSERHVKHYYGVWHLQKELSKKLEKLSRNKDCQVLRKWFLSIKNHLHWSAVSSQEGPEKVAKWKSLVNHIQNVHMHDDPLFPTCAHPHRVSRDPRKWLKPGSRVLYKVEKLLLNERVLRDVGKLSHHHQTSALEAFHRVIQRFAPNNHVFPFIGRLCRLHLAAMHFNENVSRSSVTFEGVMCPKSKKGRPTARPTCGYVRDLMRLLFMEVLADPAACVEELPVGQASRGGGQCHTCV